MAKNVQSGVEYFNSFAVGAKLLRYFNDKAMMFVRNSSGRLLARNKTQYAHLHAGAFYVAIDGMNTIVFTP
jgi:hypothetical protein